MTRTLTLVIAALLATPSLAFDLPNLTFPAPTETVTPSTQGIPAPVKPQD